MLVGACTDMPWDDRRNSWRWVQLGVTSALPWSFTVRSAGTPRWTDREGDWLPFADGPPRKDLTRTIRVFAHRGERGARQ